ncbi:hypothetical protein HJ581_0022635 [Rhodococcus opacus]|nr:hypothetical protein HJ581_0022635 [Rhodococcus opacus]
MAAYPRASVAAHVTLGRITNRIPDSTATRLVEISAPSTTTPAPAAPVARALGNRAENSEAPNAANQ